jgi:nitroreductase
MQLRELVLKNRSVRRFRQDQAVAMAQLESLLDLARNTASAGNLQPLRYVLSTDPAKNAEIFACLGWAAYLADWPGPSEGERPAAYIVICHDAGVAPKVDCDHGIAAQTILLGAAEAGLSGCMLASVNRNKLARVLNLPESLPILLVLALGRAAEQVVLEELPADGSIRYWRDQQGLHHVPKRGLGEIIAARYAGPTEKA